ncbi:MAG: exopolyphosphatase [Deltaproteobacteria bacterium]|nr:exopolyphosphatase [Deltaproteobacteria bacterium]
MRLVTRSDFDGLACAVLLEEIGLITDYKFVHPKDVQDGLVEVTGNDVRDNVPYLPGCGMWFDHHSSEKVRFDRDSIVAQFPGVRFQGNYRAARSCARVIYDYFGGAKKFSRHDESGLMDAVDRSDSADFTVQEVLNPKGWVMLSFIMDARTGLGLTRDYSISNLELMRRMITYCRTRSVEEILQIPDVKERVERYFKQEAAYQEMLLANSRVDENVIVIDLRKVTDIPSGNRFVEYALYPDQNVSLRAFWGKAKQKVVFTVGRSIFNKTCRTDVGALMLNYGGGGHERVGTCQVAEEEAERVLAELLAALKVNG